MISNKNLGTNSKYRTVPDTSEQPSNDNNSGNKESKYASLFRDNHAVMLLIDPDSSDIIDANRAACEFYGWSYEKLTDKKIFEINVLSEDEIRCEMQRAENEDRNHFLFRHRLANGEVRDVEVHSGPILIDGKKLLYSMIYDITESKLAERERLFLASIVENTSKMCVVKDLNLRVIAANMAFAKANHKDSVAELIGKTDAEILDISPNEEPAKSYMQNEYRVQSLQKGKEIRQEARININGEERIVASRKFPIFNDDGKLIATAGISLDMTDLKRTEEKLVLQESRLKTLIDILQSKYDTIQELLDNALHEAVRLTDSKIGYIYHYDEIEKKFKLNTWSGEVMKECSISDPDTTYRLEDTGIWGEAVRQRRSMIINDFQAQNPLKKGYPEGHVELYKYMTIPVFRDEKIAAVVGVANKESDYTETDVLQLTLLMDSVWNTVEQKEAEIALKNSEKKFRGLFENAISAVAVHRIIKNDEGNPVDYIFLDANKAFEEHTGLKLDNVLGRRVTEVLPGIESTLFIETYGKVALTGTPITFEEFSEPLQRYYNISAYKVDEDTFATVFQDITERKNTQLKLIESEERFRRLAENADDLIYRYEFKPERRFSYVSPAATKLLGYTPEEHYDDPDLGIKLVHPDDRHLFNELINYDGEDSTTVTLRWIRRDGKVIWTEQKNTLIYNNEEEIVAIESIARDITERRRTELYHDIGDEILSIVSESAPIEDLMQKVVDLLKRRTGADAVGIRLKDGEDFPYISYEGFTEDFIKEENSIIMSDDRDENFCRDSDGNVCLECTCGLVISGKTDPSNPLFTSRGSCWTNNSLPLLNLSPNEDPRSHPRNQCIHEGFASVALVPIRTKDKIVGLLQINDHETDFFSHGIIEHLEDIAAHIGESLVRNQAEKSLRESEEKYRLLSDVTFEGIAIHDDGTVLEANEALSRILGYTRDELIGKNILPFIFHPDDLDIVRQHMTKDTAKPYEVRGLKKNGSVIPIEIEAYNFVHDGKQIRVAAVRDITERKRSEELLKKKSDELERYFTSSLDLLCIANAKGEFIRLNPEWERVLGYPIEELKGVSFLDFVHPDDIETTLDAISYL
ncbi:PAS domain S-box protein [Methanolobus bombayensis]|uniref:PAS domain S-box protein n=1 Tax=Methanolobus bombayensis TaxID=38023 RepID=UPI001AE2C5A4|nr:PAS domain S-box protein [Methanolobus bombayensis]MBP1908612.1 PAS domain S-box-containing protein [Methanolobus bombayensis]